MRRFTTACLSIVLALAIAAVLLNGAPSDDFRFAILGDRTGSVRPDVYEQVWREISGWRPDLVINVGDTIEGGSDATAQSQWDAVKPLFAKYKQYPMYFTPGNHDIWSEASERAYQASTKRPAHYSFDYGSAHFTVLDNSRTEGLDDTQMKFLESDLEKNRDRPLKFIFFHKPFWLIPVMLGADFPLHRLALRYHVQYVVSGHTHKFARFQHAGVTYLMVGSSGAHLRGTGFKEGWFYHHVRATVAAGKVSMTIKETDAPFGEGRSMTEQEWGSGPMMRAPEGDGKKAQK